MLETSKKNLREVRVNTKRFAAITRSMQFSLSLSSLMKTWRRSAMIFIYNVIMIVIRTWTRNWKTCSKKMQIIRSAATFWKLSRVKCCRRWKTWNWYDYTIRSIKCLPSKLYLIRHYRSSRWTFRSRLVKCSKIRYTIAKPSFQCSRKSRKISKPMCRPLLCDWCRISFICPAIP